MSIYGNWRTATIALGATDSGVVDLGNNYEYIQVVLPTLDSGVISIKVAEKSTDTFVVMGNSSAETATTTGGHADVYLIGGWQFIKICSDATQTASREIKVRGSRA